LQLISLGLAAGLLACSHDAILPLLEQVDVTGVYSYSAYAGDALVVRGDITLGVDPDSTITGTWRLARVPGSDTTVVVGPQIGKGTLVGRLDSDGAWVDLNPGWADNNVFLDLPRDSTLPRSGSWSFSTIVGPVASGRVELQRLQR
jgi:hypothetical protein